MKRGQPNVTVIAYKVGERELVEEVSRVRPGIDPGGGEGGGDGGRRGGGEANGEQAWPSGE